MYNIKNELKELDLLIESTKEEFNDYAEALLNEYSFDEVRPLLESAHFEAELIITEAEDEQVNKIKEAVDEAKDKVEDKFNSPAYTKKCKEIEEAIKADPSVGEQLVEVPDVENICKDIIAYAKKGEKVDIAIAKRTETISLKKLMLKRKRIERVVIITLSIVFSIVPFVVIKKQNEKIYNSVLSGTDKPAKFDVAKIVSIISSIVGVASQWCSRIVSAQIQSLKRGINEEKIKLDALREIDAM